MKTRKQQLTVSRLLIANVLLAIGFISAASAQDEHTVSSGTWQKTPVSTAEMNQRVAKASLKLREYPTVPRVGFFDLAQPADLPEYVALGGNAVVLVTVVTHQEAELPLQRVYLDWRGESIELALLAKALSRVTEPEVSETLGAYRMDALYLVPLFKGFDEAKLMTDFAANRTDFQLGSISGSLIPAEDRMRVELSKAPNMDALQRFIQREYPGFAKLIKRRVCA